MLMLPLQATLGRTMNITEGMLKREKVNEVLPQILDWKSRDSNTIEADAHTSRITARRDEWESFHIKINTKVSFLLFFFFLASIFLFDLEGNSWESKYIYLSFFPLKTDPYLLCRYIMIDLSEHELHLHTFHSTFSCTSHSTHAGAGGLIHESHVQKKKIYIYIYALHIQRWEAFGFWIKVSKLHALIFMAGAAVFSPDEAHLRSPSGSSLCLRSPPSAHTPACLRPSWWWSALRSQVRRGKMRLWHGG